MGAGADAGTDESFPMPFGEYSLVRRIGKGGMAVVYEAERRGLTLALKRPLSGFLDDDRFRERFLREAEAMGRLAHPCIVDVFEVGQKVDVVGTSIGKGFAGTIKRHHFRRGPETHGSDSHRAPGSIGGGTYPGKVFRGSAMAGHMGHERVTVKNATIVRTDSERNLLLVKGPVPGPRNALVVVRKA